MLRRIHGYLALRKDPVPDASVELQEDGFVVLREVLDAAETRALAAAVTAVFDELPPDLRGMRDAAAMTPFRYEMLNRSALCQQAAGHPRILEVIEPLLGDDCHVIANTAWRNPPGEAESRKGGPWHIDAGPHVPRPPDVPWDDRIPYPIFAVGAHILLEDCGLESGPTGAIPASHKSGRLPPFEKLFDDDVTCNGATCEPLVGRAGDVALFASDTWHRRMPTRGGDRGRFFLQVHYGRRDIAQRLWPSDRANQLSQDAIERAGDDRRARNLIGLHDALFYDG